MRYDMSNPNVQKEILSFIIFSSAYSDHKRAKWRGFHSSVCNAVKLLCLPKSSLCELHQMFLTLNKTLLLDSCLTVLPGQLLVAVKDTNCHIEWLIEITYFSFAFSVGREGLSFLIRGSKGQSKFVKLAKAIRRLTDVMLL